MWDDRQTVFHVSSTTNVIKHKNDVKSISQTASIGKITSLVIPCCYFLMKCERNVKIFKKIDKVHTGLKDNKTLTINN